MVYITGCQASPKTTKPVFCFVNLLLQDLDDNVDTKRANIKLVMSLF